MYNLLGSAKMKHILGAMLIMSLLGFELYNFGTTEFSLLYFYPTQELMGIRWAALLAVAACLTDFAGVATAFTEAGDDLGIWLIRGGWFLSAFLNALLTWWGTLIVLLAIPNLGNELVTRGALLTWIPSMVAIFVWLIRISLIGAIILYGTPTKAPAIKAPVMLGRRLVKTQEKQIDPENGRFEAEK